MPVPDYLVNFVVVDGGGSVFAGAALTSHEGLAIDYWTLGPVLGEQHVEVRSVNSNTGQKEVWGTFVAIAKKAPEIVQLQQGGHNWSTAPSFAVGQTFTPLNGSFDSFSFWMGGELGNVFEVFLYEWDSGVRAKTGSELWSSGPRTAPQDVGGVAGEVVFTPRLALNPNLVYLLFVYQSAFPQISVRTSHGNPYAGGQNVRAEFPAGTSPDDAFSRANIAASESFFGDLSDEDMKFTAQFSPTVVPEPPTVVPEPSTWVLLATGLLGMGIVARRRKKEEEVRAEG